MEFNTFILLILVHLISDCTDAQRDKKFFRKDYVYLETTQSFYKLHTVHRTWSEYKKVCALEGASLYYPEDEKEATEVLAFIKTRGINDIYIGMSDLLVEGQFITIDGKSVLDVYNKWGSGEPNNDMNEDCVGIRGDLTLNDYMCAHKLPAVCKKPLASVEWSYECQTPYRNYVYNEEFNKCYKFYENPMNWVDALTMCGSELAYLAVINSQTEADYLVSLTNSAPKNKPGTYLKGIVLLGFHNQFDEGWTTMQGKTLEDSGYDYWANDQPDGSDKEKCGSMFYNGRLNDINCEAKAFFICERELPPPATVKATDVAI